MLNFRKYPHSGFTLLELLVVVLIIGILAGIALPQYKMAVDKTEFTKLRSLAKTLADAYQRFYMVNNRYPYDFESLDVSLPDGYIKKYISNISASCEIINDFYCCMAPQKTGQDSTVTCGKNNYKFGIWLSYPESSQNMYCVAEKNDIRSEALCKHISGKTSNNGCTGFLTPEGFKGGHCFYSINKAL